MFIVMSKYHSLNVYMNIICDIEITFSMNMFLTFFRNIHLTFNLNVHNNLNTAFSEHSDQCNFLH